MVGLESIGGIRGRTGGIQKISFGRNKEREDRLRYRRSIWLTKKKNFEIWFMIGSVRSCER